MRREELIHALDLCTNSYPENFCPCDHCPMMKAGCDEPNLESVTIPCALVEEIYKQLDPAKSEFTHVKFLS